MEINRSSIDGKANRKVLVFLFISQAIYLLFLFVWFLFLGLSVMMFDNPSSGSISFAVSIFIAICGYPLAVIVSIILAWIFYKRRQYRKSILWNLLPILWIIPITGMFLYANLH